MNVCCGCCWHAQGDLARLCWLQYLHTDKAYICETSILPADVNCSSAISTIKCYSHSFCTVKYCTHSSALSSESLSQFLYCEVLHSQFCNVVCCTHRFCTMKIMKCCTHRFYSVKCCIHDVCTVMHCIQFCSVKFYTPNFAIIALTILNWEVLHI